MSTNLKNLLLVSTALVGVAMMSAPASAAVKLDLGGYFRGYGVYTDNHEAPGVANSLNNFEFRRDSDVFFTGETVLDNGLTIGAHSDLKLANGGAQLNNNGGNFGQTVGNVNVEQEYAYASGGWGRFNFGLADGAAYLLQVAAPSADSNIDGLRVRIQALNPNNAGFQNATIGTTAFNDAVLEYAQDDFRYTDRLTYLTPKFSGFQGAASYAPTQGVTSNTLGMGFSDNGGAVGSSGAGGAPAAYKDLWEVSARWDGEFQGLGIAAGGAWGDSKLQHGPTAANEAALAGGVFDVTDGVQTYNGGLNFTYQGFSLGGGYKHSKTSRVAQTVTAGALAANVDSGDVIRKTWDIGLGYDNGPYHVGGSYIEQKTNFDALFTAAGVGNQNIAATEFKTTRYALGGGYTFGPGMTFRGAVAWGKFDAPGVGVANDNDFTQVSLGTDIQF